MNHLNIFIPTENARDSLIEKKAQFMMHFVKSNSTETIIAIIEALSKCGIINDNVFNGIRRNGKLIRIFYYKLP